MEVRLFNSLKYAKTLESSGVTREPAEAHIQILSRVIGEDVATKQDVMMLSERIDSLKIATRQDIALLNEKIDSFKVSSRNELHSLEAKMDRGFRLVDDKIEKLQYRLQYDLVMKLGALMTFLFGAALGVAGLFFT